MVTISLFCVTGGTSWWSLRGDAFDKWGHQLHVDEIVERVHPEIRKTGPLPVRKKLGIAFEPVGPSLAIGR